MAEIWAGLSHKPIFFSQKSASIGLRILACLLCIGRLGVYIYPFIRHANRTAGKHQRQESLSRPVELIWRVTIIFRKALTT